MSDRAVSRLESFVRHALAFLWIALGAVLLGLTCLAVLPSRRLRVRAGTWFCNRWAGPTLKLLGTTLDVQGVEKLLPSAPAVYISNHSSDLDPFLCMQVMVPGTSVVAKREILAIPFFGQTFWLTGHLLINRKNHKTAVDAINALSGIVADNDLSIWIWPEGTQPEDGRLLPFKLGFVHMAVACGLPVVPVVAHDAHIRNPARSRTLRPGTLRVDVLDPIDTSSWSHDTARTHADELHALFVSHLADHQRPLTEA